MRKKPFKTHAYNTKTKHIFNMVTGFNKNTFNLLRKHSYLFVEFQLLLISQDICTYTLYLYPMPDTQTNQQTEL